MLALPHWSGWHDMSATVFDVEDYSQITALIYSAAVDPTRWQDVLERLSVLAGGIRTHLFGHDLRVGRALNVVTSQYDPDYLRTYDEYYGAKNGWAPGFAAAPVGQPVPTKKLWDWAHMQHSEFYNDWVRPQQDIVAGGGAVLFRESDRIMVFGGNIPRRDGERLEKRWLELAGLLIPHVQQAFEIGRMLDTARIQTFAAQQLQAGPEAALLLLAADRRILWADAGAQALLAAGNPLRQDLGGRLGLADPAAEAALGRALTALRHGSGDLHRGASSFRLGRDPGGYLCRSAVFAPERPVTAPFGLLSVPGAPCLLLALERLRPAADRCAPLMRRFGMTRTEAEVSLLLAEDCTPAEIAAAREVSIHTVRRQIKTALAKAGARRQAELVRIVLRTAE